MRRVIHHTFGPHADWKQAWLAFTLLLQPWRWMKGRQSAMLADFCKKLFHGETFLFDAGRSALCAFLRAAEIGTGDEVIIQGYTCVVLPNAIHAVGARVVYADISDETLNIHPEALVQCITPQTKAIICQHTFGIPSDLQALRYICNQRNILLIEDCAHSLPDAKGPKSLAMIGDAVLLSFGRDKAISGIAGGAIICRKATLVQRMQQEEQSAGNVLRSRVVRLLLYPMLYAVARPLYAFGIGKLLLFCAGKLHLLVPIVTKTEKEGRQDHEPCKIPEACAVLAYTQLQNLEHINNHRRLLTALYLREIERRKWRENLGVKVPSAISGDLPLQKFPIFMKHAKQVRSALQQQNIYLDDGWTGCVVCPASITINETEYEAGSDPVAEELCQAILSLPTHPQTTIADALCTIDAIETAWKNRTFLPQC